MIKNIVFDMGNVLIRFDPEMFMDQEGVTDEAARELIRRELFHSVEWAQMDLGVLTEETAEPLVLKRIPMDLREQVKRLLNHWWDKRICIEGMEDVLQDLKASGYRIYLLSNASTAQHHYWPTFPMSRLFDGKLISCDYGVVKPNPEIYHLFIRQFGLKTEECLFIDDQPANIAAAIQCGWSGIVFHGKAEELKKKMKSAGIIVKRWNA